MATILVIEDNQAVSTMYNRQLSFEGYSVVVATDGLEGLDKAKKEMPSLILLDIVLPKLSGLDVLARLKKIPETKKIPVIAISAFSSEENKKQALDSGAVEFIEKEKVDLSMVAKIIKKYLPK